MSKLFKMHTNSLTGVLSFRVIPLAIACLLGMSRNLFAGDSAIDSVMYHDPELPKPKVVRTLPEHVEDLWLTALCRPEQDYQYQAAVTITQAHREGMKRLQTAIEPLLECLGRANQRPSVRLAAAQALIELDAREAAPRLFKQTQSGNSDLRRVIEPALAPWDYQPLRAVWLERLAHPETSANDLLLAIRGFLQLRDNEAAPALEKLIFSPSVSVPIRLEAARVLGELRTSGSEASAQRLMEKGKDGHLAAAWLLRHHQGAKAVRLLTTLAKDSQPLVVLIALQRLTEIDWQLGLPFVNDLLASSDPDLRLLAIDILFHQPTLERVQLLGAQLHDRHPDVRSKARRSLRDLGMKPDWRSAVIEQGLRALAENEWQGLEQAIILLAELDHKPAGQRFLELLTFERPEVFLAAAWGLRRLAVPETLPAALRYFDRLQQQLRAIPGPKDQPLPEEALDDQLAQLAQLFGQARYMPADPILRRAIPRPPPTFPGDPPPKERALSPQARAAGVWALGLIHESKPISEVTRELLGLLNAGAPRRFPGEMVPPPEDFRVRWMAAVSLGRIKVKDALDDLRRSYVAKKPSLDPVNNACGWAIAQITGQPLPAAGTVEPRGEPFKNWLRSVNQNARSKL